MNKERSSEAESAATASEQAYQWWLVLSEGTASQEDRAAFAAWVARGPEHVAAYLQVLQLQKALRAKHLRWPDTPVDVLAQEAQLNRNVVALARNKPAPGALSRQSVRLQSSRFLAAAAAAVVVAIIAGVWIFSSFSQRYETRIGEQRSIVLSDGSLVTLNTSSVIQVELTAQRRTILLLSGEVLFQVAPDKTRPFDVIAGGTRVHVVGTRFNVDRSGGPTTVTVVEGKVSVENGATRPDDNSVARNALFLGAGESVTVTASGARQPAAADPATATAWTQRRLIFEHRPLGEVADEFNRYNRREIRIQGNELRSQEVTGIFHADDPDSFLQFVEKIPGVHIERTADNIQVTGMK